ncbi:MAG: bifunctional 5,10-methylene-tetrahydrofolate dehydrogenase/5,10-methylene-tetrahydrofolate cyclohydrolase [Bacteroidetes bacterium]|jgi:methylenetetrahydrofolate dehydrogenase (NADP+) / methenyltetrahydrofolate cyclohydrolase|nr:bifunctional 5,10-methylene-tetrahydrofolate dehydrogenase/5,10-methylene-tetrahydrofolate cyclohydrolase [Bacteroidota bacterium]
MRILNGKETAESIKLEIAEEVKARLAAGKSRPHLAAVLVGENGASLTYVNAKVKACAKVGFESTLVKLDADISEEELLKEVHKLNDDPSIHGFIVQLPLPDHIDDQRIIEAVSPEKDVDGFHPLNVGRMVLGLPCFLPATPYGILQLLEKNDIQTEGKHCLVLGRSNIVGSPMSILLARNSSPGNCTVTLAHSRTKDIKSLSLQADIIIAAVGRPHFLTADMVKEGAVIVDVGIHRIEDKTKKSGYRLIGDVDFDEVASKTEAISPVPGGVGPMTIVALLKNTLQAAG